MPSIIISGSRPEFSRPSLALSLARAAAAMSSVKTVLALGAAGAGASLYGAFPAARSASVSPSAPSRLIITRGPVRGGALAGSAGLSS